MAYFVPEGQPLLLPGGTIVVRDAMTWAIYYNARMNATWLVWHVPKGIQVMPLPGHYNVNYDVGDLSSYIQSRQAAGCQACD